MATNINVKYLKDENGNKISPVVSTESIYSGGGSKLIDYIYPVGSIYMSVNSTNPRNFIWRNLDTIKR